MMGQGKLRIEVATLGDACLSKQANKFFDERSEKVDYERMVSPEP